MIYRNSYFDKEFRQSYIKNKVSVKNMIGFGIFIGLLAFALHFILQTLQESVLVKAVPQLMIPSYFAVLTCFNIVAQAFFIIYFLIKYEYLSFNEIRSNKWYVLIKMGYKAPSMIFNKISALLFSVLITYTIGFVFACFMTAFLKYPFVIGYFLPMYITGIIDIILIIFISLTSSLFIKNQQNARYFIVASVLLLIFIKLNTNYFSTTSNRDYMRSMSGFLNESTIIYMLTVVAIIAVCVGLCFIGAKKVSSFVYSTQGIPDNIVIINREGKIKTVHSQDTSKTSKILNICINALLILFILSSLALNLLVLAVSVATPEKEIAISGKIPYVFQSITISPEIEKNDLVLFNKIDENFVLKEGDVVLFKENGKIYVERIQGINNESITVDIDNYPAMSKEGSMIQNPHRESIYGVLSSTHPWLGALILFANTIFGRLIFLFVPTFLLFFYRPILRAVKKLTD
ncbi:MAG: S26 family signal peptidase [Clostridiales bacterium]|nr:MAG: S26 family signal peptidase [Clostridiales bacterium]